MLSTSSGPERYPHGGDVYHKVRINYYPPRTARGWDSIDICWLHTTQLKVDFTRD